MGGPDHGEELGYLCIDAFIRDVVSARALASALELGIIDRLLQGQPCTLADLGERAKLDGRGLRLLLGMLRANRVVAEDGGQVTLTAAFAAALQYRDLLEAKLDFASLVAPDFLDLFTVLLVEPARFFSEAKLFELFSYQNCFDPSPENYASTARWMRFTTTLTRYESAACLERHDFSRYRQMLDVGGNSGEFALRILRRHAHLRAAVYDLPLVCDLGEKHVAGEPEADRMNFVKADASVDALPGNNDLVAFKSMLHDWPDEEAWHFLARAHRALKPGGTLLIFERSLLEAGGRQLPYSLIPILLFFRSYRSGDDYKRRLEQAGFRDVKFDTVNLDMPFMLLTARK